MVACTTQTHKNNLFITYAYQWIFPQSQSHMPTLVQSEETCNGPPVKIFFHNFVKNVTNLFLLLITLK